MKKMSLILITFAITILSACSNSTWVLEKDRIGEDTDIERYADKLQSDYPDFRGYKVFTISEGSKMIVVSTGSSEQSLKFKDAIVTNDKTTITLEEENKQTSEENSFIMIGIEEIKGELSVVNESGDGYTEFAEEN
jgi:ABC-type microcin C transport system duplicated ATPase subunit YejF